MNQLEKVVVAYLSGLALAAVLGVVGRGAIEKVEKVQYEKKLENVMAQGYINPTTVKLTAEDLNRDGEYESVFEVKGKSYLLRYKQDSTPEIVEDNLESR